MRIYKLKEIKVGNYLTFVCISNDSVESPEQHRRFLKVDSFATLKNNDIRFTCSSICENYSGGCIIDNLFQHISDEAYETLQDITLAFPEFFI